MASNPTDLLPTTEAAQIDACLELASKGFSTRSIARLLNERGIKISHETVRGRLKRGYETVQLPNMQQAMTASHERLLGMLDALGPAIARGEPEAVRAAARVESLILDLFGMKHLNITTEVTHRVTYELEMVAFDPKELTNG